MIFWLTFLQPITKVINTITATTARTAAAAAAVVFRSSGILTGTARAAAAFNRQLTRPIITGIGIQVLPILPLLVIPTSNAVFGSIDSSTYFDSFSQFWSIFDFG